MSLAVRLVDWREAHEVVVGGFACVRRSVRRAASGRMRNDGRRPRRRKPYVPQGDDRRSRCVVGAGWRPALAAWVWVVVSVLIESCPQAEEARKAQEVASMDRSDDVRVVPGGQPTVAPWHSRGALVQYLEALCDENMDQKLLGTSMLLQLARDVTNLGVMINNGGWGVVWSCHGVGRHRFAVVLRQRRCLVHSHASSRRTTKRTRRWR